MFDTCFECNTPILANPNDCCPPLPHTFYGRVYCDECFDNTFKPCAICDHRDPEPDPIDGYSVCGSCTPAIPAFIENLSDAPRITYAILHAVCQYPEGQLCRSQTNDCGQCTKTFACDLWTDFRTTLSRINEGERCSKCGALTGYNDWFNDWPSLTDEDDNILCGVCYNVLYHPDEKEERSTTTIDTDMQRALEAIAQKERAKERLHYSDLAAACIVPLDAPCPPCCDTQRNPVCIACFNKGRIRSIMNRADRYAIGDYGY